MSKIALEALGGESGKYLSHANNEVWLQTGNQGDGEVFIKEDRPNGRVALACIGYIFRSIPVQKFGGVVNA